MIVFYFLFVEELNKNVELRITTMNEIKHNCETCKFNFNTWCRDKNRPEYCKTCPNFDKELDDCRCNMAELIYDDTDDSYTQIEYCRLWTPPDDK